MGLLTIIAVAAASFIATGLDNLLILVGLLGGGYPRRAAAVGYLSGMGLVVATAAGLSVAAHQLPPGILGYLGLIPIGLGVWHVTQLVRRESLSGSQLRTPATTGILAVALVTVAASGDSLATFAALLSDSEVALALPILLTLAACAVGWLGLARYLSTHAGVARVLRRAGPFLIPALMIAIGTYILLDSPTDVVGLQDVATEVLVLGDVGQALAHELVVHGYGLARP